MELKQTDRKLLGFLYHSNREPLTKIAKATGLSREQVDYRINKYIEEGIIRKFFTVFNYSKIGYPYFTLLLLKFNKYSDLNSFKENLGKNRHCISYGNILGKYDMYMNLVFKDEKELNEYLAELINKDLSDYLLIKPYFTELYPLKFLKDKKEEKSFLLADYSGSEVKLEKTEIEILKLLNEDGRIRIIDIANREDERLFAHSNIFRLTIVNAGNDEQCTTIYESGNPEEKMNIFYLRDSGFEGGNGDYNAITQISVQRLRDIPPIGTTPGLNEKFNFYRNELPSNLACFGNGLISCNVHSVLSSALLCNKPVKISNLRNSFSDKTVVFTTPSPIYGGYNWMFTTPYLSEIAYRYSSSYDYLTWADSIVHEFGHSFSFFHTHDYCTFLSIHTNLFGFICIPLALAEGGNEEARRTIMNYDWNGPGGAGEYFRYADQINNRIDCYERWDLPDDIQPPSAQFFCNDDFASDSEFLVAHLSEIP